MRKHFENIKVLYGNASVRIPNEIFTLLSSSIKSKNGNSNIQQVSFAYSYLIIIAFLYKYAHFVDVNNKTYIQNSDIKEMLGYDKSTKSVDRIIKKGGVLDEIGITCTTNDYPVSFCKNSQMGSEMSITEFTYISDVANECNYSIFKNIVKNRNYIIKEPLFLIQGIQDREFGTLCEIEKTHMITIDELLSMFFDEKVSTIDILMYFYFKSKCKGFKKNMRAIPLEKILNEVGIEKKSFYRHLEILKTKKYMLVRHKGWKPNVVDSELNEYLWKGINQK